MEQKRFDATLIHTHTFDMSDLPETIRYAKDRVEDAIKVVVTNKFTYAKDIAAEKMLVSIRTRPYLHFLEYEY